MNRKMKHGKVYIIIFLMLFLFLPSVHASETQMNLFNISPETQISAPDIDCNYWKEDYGKAGYNFEYPKLIMANKGKPLIAFIDEKSNNLFLADISNQKVSILYNQPSHDLNSWRKWPVIFEKENKIYFALLSDVQQSIERLRVYLFDQENGKLELEEDKLAKIDKGCSLWGVYPHHKYFTLVGVCNYIPLRYLHTYLLGGVPVFYHNVSYTLNDNNNGDKGLTRQYIEEKGCYSVEKQVYDISMSGTLQAAWIRNTTTLGLKHDEMVFLSVNKDDNSWTSPKELYSIKNTEVTNKQINNLSLASYGNSSFVLLQDREKGIFFSELNNGNKIEFTRISDRKDIDAVLPLATAIKVAADNDGNAYALWIENSRNANRLYDYKLYLKTRINGQWTQDIIINKGSGVVKLPDMKVDQEGNVHITYIKSIGEVKQYGGKYGCFYMKLTRQDKKGQ